MIYNILCNQILDNYKLIIRRVKDFDTNEYLNCRFGDNTNFGNSFTIYLPRTVGDVNTNTM